MFDPLKPKSGRIFRSKPGHLIMALKHIYILVTYNYNSCNFRVRTEEQPLVISTRTEQ